ncbi:MAG: DegT/DnrJ/EryC1/StrS family aminotransferase [Thermodesulfobacteriota bacterium]
MITITKTYLPPIEEYIGHLKDIWQKGWLTNDGDLVKDLADYLRSYLNVPHLRLVANGTLALQIAVKGLVLQGEIIKTPFSHIATTSAIIWEGCDPVFVDIENKSFCIDADLIEAAITERTSAILATHIYGYPCNVDKIEQIARKYQLKIIFDAAHAFGVKLNGRSITEHGDISALSFHATKMFHTAEGGAIVCEDQDLAKRIYLMTRFGHLGEDDYFEVGINAKMSELHAAMGLAVLPMVDRIITRHKIHSEHYTELLASLPLTLPALSPGLEYNYAYYPVIFDSHDTMQRVRDTLQQRGTMPRRYFYPSLNTLPFLRPGLRRSCPISEDISDRILCLPLYYGMSNKDVHMIVDTVVRVLTT